MSMTPFDTTKVVRECARISRELAPDWWSASPDLVYDVIMDIDRESVNVDLVAAILNKCRRPAMVPA